MILRWPDHKQAACCEIRLRGSTVLTFVAAVLSHPVQKLLRIHLFSRHHVIRLGCVALSMK